MRRPSSPHSEVPRLRMRLRALPVAVLLGLMPAGVALAAGSDAGSAEDVTVAAVEVMEFSQHMLHIPVDTRMFTRGLAHPAGTYRVDLVLNEEWKGRVSLRFELLNPDDRIALPCFDLGLLEMLGFDLTQLGERARALLDSGTPFCRPLGELFAGAAAHYDVGSLNLLISAPQAVLRREARGYVDPSQWDHGITAGTLNYHYNAYRSQNRRTGSSTSQYLNLRAGLNLGAWRLRYHASAGHSDQSGLHYRAAGAWAERALPGWNSQLMIGNTVTDGQVFDSLRFSGAKLGSDERMRPDSQRGFAPVVRGIAQTNARISISQLGREIYQTNVPPGAFVIDDLYPTGTSGDLLVTITEADGSEHSFTIAYAATVELLRPGRTLYSLAAGRYDNPALVSEPSFIAGTLRHGFSNRMTGYTGLMVAESYSALAGGLAFNLPIGALAADFTFANTRTTAPGSPGDDHNYRGSSVRVTWAKVLPVWDTRLNMASYRYSSSGYYGPAEAFALHDQVLYGQHQGRVDATRHPRNRLVIHANQPLPGKLGYLGLAASSQDYWNHAGRETQYQLNWNRSLRRASLGVSASRTFNVFRQRWDNQFMLNLSMPLGRSALRTQSAYTHRAEGQALQTSVSGVFGAERQFSARAFVSGNTRERGSHQYSGGVGASWSAPKAQLAANVSTGNRGTRQYGFNMSGGVVASAGGVMFTPQLGETIGIIEAEHAAGAHVTKQARHLLINTRGYAVLPGLHPFRQNEIGLDPLGLSTDVELASTTRKIAPTAGAVALIRFETERAHSILVRARREDGRDLPFAAQVLDAEQRLVGYVSQGGRALLRVHELKGELTVNWGPEAEQTCRFSYAVPDEAEAGEGMGFRRVEAVCAADIQGSAGM